MLLSSAGKALTMLTKKHKTKIAFMLTAHVTMQFSSECLEIISEKQKNLLRNTPKDIDLILVNLETAQ